MKRTPKKLTSAAMLLGMMLTCGPALAADTPSGPAPGPETRTLDQIYQAALAEGGRLVVYAGGDVPDGNAGVEKAFKERFPGIDIRIVTDLSKYHDMRIDQQLARNRLECDVAHLQTMHDFDRWKAMDLLEPYKPLGWEAVYPEFKDPDGAFTAVKLFSFSNTVANAIPDGQAPREALDYLDPSLKGKIVLTYPHDDDAVLYQFDRIISVHGWEYLDTLMRQDVQWIRGTVPAARVVGTGSKLATFTASGALAPGKTSRFILPKAEPFLAWPQMAAIFRHAKHKEAARLYLSWLLDKETIKAMPYQWTVRRDAENPGGYQTVYAYNTDMGAFRRFMADRALVERLKGRFEQVIGPITGNNPTGASGLYLPGNESGKERRQGECAAHREKGGTLR